MELNVIKVGLLQTNCYILNINNNVLIIDPGDEVHKIISFLEEHNLNLQAILITHSHDDHIGALNDLLNYKQVKVYDNSNTEEKEYQIGDFKFNVIKNYGHTNDSISFYFQEDKIMFVGDFIFDHSIGRTDLPTGDILEMMKSIKKIKQYPNDITIYPGHGNHTILGIEKEENIYFN